MTLDDRVLDELERLCRLSMDPATDIAEANNAAVRVAEMVSEMLPELKTARQNERHLKRLIQHHARFVPLADAQTCDLCRDTLPILNEKLDAAGGVE